MGLLLKLRTVVWGAPAETKTERRLIVKIDVFIMSYVCLMVSQSNVSRRGPMPLMSEHLVSNAY